MTHSLQFQFSHSVMFDSLWPHGLQHARCLCPPPSPRVCSSLRPLSCWCYLIISSSVTLSPAFNLSQHQGLFPSDLVQFSRSVVSDSLWPHEPQHTKPPCPSPTPRVHPNPCPLSRWYHPTISSSAVPFSSQLQSFPASGSFQMSKLFASGGQSIGV